jgi:hypothetical protein
MMIDAETGLGLDINAFRCGHLPAKVTVLTADALKMTLFHLRNINRDLIGPKSRIKVIAGHDRHDLRQCVLRLLI